MLSHEIRLESNGGFLTQDQINRVKDDFLALDIDKDNKLAPADVGTLFLSLGQSITVEELSAILEPLPREGLTSDEFIFFFSRHYREPEEDALLKALGALDANRIGTLPVSGFRDLLTSMGEPLSMEYADIVLREVETQAGDVFDYRRLVERLSAMCEDDFPERDIRQVGTATSARVLQISDFAEEMDAASTSAAKGSKRPLRSRVNTGYLDLVEASEKVVRIGNQVEELDAASAATAGPRRSVRHRISTGFDHGGSPTSGLRISNDVEELAAASAATGGPKRAVRHRINTGFEAEVKKPEVGLQISNDVEELAAASAATGGAKRPLRQRINTGFEKDADPASQQLQINSQVDEPNTTSPATVGSNRVTGQGPKALQISGVVEELDAASIAKGGPKRSLRQRINTGFEREVEQPKDALKISNEVEELDAASKATGGPKEALRHRINTGFEVEVEQPKDALKISNEVEELDAASKATGGPKKAVRHRINTGFEREVEQPKDALRISNEVEELDAASKATGGPKEALRHRINTGFEVEVEQPKDALKISNEVEELDAASVATGGPKRAARHRINTGFEREVEQPKEALKISNAVEELDAASIATGGPKRAARHRINTGFEREVALPKEALKISNEVEELDAASIATGSPKRAVRQRISTGFEREVELPKDALKISNEVEELDAASIATGGPKRAARQRINTGFEREVELPKEALKISNEVEELDAASIASGSPKRAVRQRINTGFEREVELPKEALKISNDVEELDAASIATGSPKRAVRQRINTGYERDESPEHIKFVDDAEAWKAASKDLQIRGPSDGSKEQSPKRTRKRSVAERRASVERRTNPEAGRDSWYDKLPEEGRFCMGPQETSVKFADKADECEAASAATDTKPRAVRGRVNTQFAADDQNSDDGDVSAPLQSRLREARKSRQSMRSTRSSMSLLSEGGSIFMKASEKRALQREVIGMESAQLAEDSPELKLEEHKVVFYDKDIHLLHDSMKKMMLFEELDDESMDDLIDAMEVFKFDGGEEVVRQGDIGGCYFFIVAEGAFEVVKDDVVIVELSAGATFGESVLLMNGDRKATVRAKCHGGHAVVYGMEADDVRDVLRFEYEKRHKDVMHAVDKIIESGSCEQLCKVLNAFQLHGLYTDSVVRNYESGDKIFVQGQEQLSEVYILVQGAVVLQRDGFDLARLPRYEMFGIEGLLFGDVETTAKVDGMGKTLVMSRALLEKVFEVAKMPTALLRGRVLEQLNQMVELAKLSDDQHALLAEAFTVQKIAPGQQLDTAGVCFVMGLHHEILVSTDGFASNIESLQGVDHPAIGLDNLLDPELPWSFAVRAARKKQPAWVAVWRTSDVRAILAKNETQERLAILRMVWLFRTLSKQQLAHLADAMETEHYEDGEFVFEQGDMGDAFYIIGSGRMQVTRSGRFIRGLEQGDYFGERALLKHDVRSASIEAAETSVIWKITHETFHAVMRPAMVDYLAHRVDLQDSEFDFEQLWLMKTIGTGGFGVVKMIQAKSGGRFALKCVRKRQLVELGCQSTVVNERNLLHCVDHPFIIKLVQAFANEAFVYLMLELVTGGELLDVLTLLGVLNQEQSQFYTGSILLAFEHLHEHRIAYLDLKSENILIDRQGFIKLVDFGLAVKISGCSYAVKGTPHFMAPEMILSKGYDTTADLWSLGICVYEFMVGELPFGNGSANKSEIFQSVLKGQVKFKDDFLQQPYSGVSIKFIKGLLTRTPSRRLGGGMNGYSELFNHEFFKDFDWDGLLARQQVPPFVPKREHYAEDNYDGAGSPGSPKACALLADVVAEEVRKELADGWEDPSPGWDDDFY